MKIPAILKLFVICSAIFINVSCAKPEVPTQHSSDEEKLIQILTDEYKIKVKIKTVGQTLWIYNPREESFINLTATNDNPSSSSEAKETIAINFLEGKYENNSFNIKYDIGPVKTYEKSYGYTTGYQEKYRQEQQYILTSVYRSFADSKNPPLFVSLVVADIKQGVEIKTTLYFKDLLRAYQDPSFYEEYTKRAIIDYPSGSKTIINDSEGRHLDFHDVTMEEFLAKQIVYRIQYKYTRSAFKPSADTEKEILTITGEAISAYNFDKFSKVELTNLAGNKTQSAAKDEVLNLIKNLPKETPGRLIHINFLEQK